MAGIVPRLIVLAALVAHAECDGWPAEALAYLTANRDFVVDNVDEYLPGIKTTAPEATFLAWFDCRETGIEDNPHEFFLEEPRGALYDGVRFGPGGEGCVLLNFGCPRTTLVEGLERMRAALAEP